MEPWATNTHCKAPICQGKNTPPNPTTHTNPLKKGQEIGLCSKPKKRMERRGKGREKGGRLMTGQSGRRCTQTGAVTQRGSSSTEPQSQRCLWKEEARLGLRFLSAQIKEACFFFFPLKPMSHATEWSRFLNATGDFWVAVAHISSIAEQCGTQTHLGRDFRFGWGSQLIGNKRMVLVRSWRCWISYDVSK